MMSEILGGVDRVELDWRQVLLLAFGSWREVGAACGRSPSACWRWSAGVPSTLIDKLLTAPTAPDWLTREMLDSGAVIRVESASRPDNALSAGAE